MPWDDARARAALIEIFAAGVAAADPRRVLAAHLPERPTGRVVVVGAGKSAALMAAAVEDAWPGVALSGLVVTRYGHGYPTRQVEVLEASHPVPDAAGAAAAARILAALQGLRPEDLVLFLVSGGGSALTTLPAPGLTLDDLMAVNRALLASGATIHEMNCIRRHLSAFSGGRVALAAAPARLVTLAISDVPGDDPAVIASGPTVPDPTSFAEARALVAHYRMTLPDAVMAHLAAARDETPKPGDPRLGATDYRFIATPMMALRAAAAAARELGLNPVILGDALEGEARGLGQALAGIALSAATHGVPAAPPCLLLSGGEATVTIGPEGHGRGGRNSEALLGAAIALGGAPGIHALMADTDGIDGSEANAGALATPTTLARARAAGLDPRALLGGHDSWTLFDALGDLVTTGPTLTNVNDLRLLLIS
jgi:glycerate-2-kinase